MICTCGTPFKLHRQGELVFLRGYIYTCDSFRCPKCDKTILSGIAGAPLCKDTGPEADSVIERAMCQGKNIYGEAKA